MGTNHSILPKEKLEEYVQLTYLNKTEINFILTKLMSIDERRILNAEDNLYSIEEITNAFLELKYNPFSDRIFDVFSTASDDSLSFEDCINLCSVFSSRCPLEVKSAWAFLIFDFNNDNQITGSDIRELLDRLTKPKELTFEEKDNICDVLLTEMDLLHLNGMNQLEFMQAIRKVPDFVQVFSFKL